MDSGVADDHLVERPTCALCQRTFTPEVEIIGHVATPNICGNCKLLYLDEDYIAPTRDPYLRRHSRRRRASYSSSESEFEEAIFQVFEHLSNLQQNQSPGSGIEDLPVDGDSVARVSHRTSSRTTSIRSRRWRRVLSDTESDGFDNTDSLYGESQSNVSFGRFRVSHEVSDVMSYSAYGGESDTSADLQGFPDTDTFIPQGDENAYDSDTDIDPMHAGLDTWNSDDLEEDDDDEDEEDDDDEWEEVESVENMVESAGADSQPRNSLVLNSGRRGCTDYWNNRRHLTGTGSPHLIWEMRERNTRDILSNYDESDMMPYATNSGDYLDAVGFEELLEHLAEADSLRRGAPPASISYVNNLPLIRISKEHEKHDDLACAICKDLLTIGTEVNQLPCFHLYHPSCIVPWLNTRNSCPLCRYELPTDDNDYEERKQIAGDRVEIHVRLQNDIEDRPNGTSNMDEEDEDPAVTIGFTRVENRLQVVRERNFHASGGENSRGGWFLFAAAPIEDPAVTIGFTRVENRLQVVRERNFHASGSENSRGGWFLFAAAPIVSLVGIVLVLWLGTPGSADQAIRHSHVAGALPEYRQNRSRRWCLFSEGFSNQS